MVAGWVVVLKLWWGLNYSEYGSGVQIYCINERR